MCTTAGGDCATDNPGVQPHAPSSAVRPLLKWAGGKRQLLPHLRRFYPSVFGRYIEPFFGSGAVFFDLYSHGRLKGRPVWLTDSNRDLVDCYLTLRDDTEAVVSALARLAEEHSARGASCYYEVRDGRFNPARLAGRAYTPELAAMLIYLNRTGFNGLFRLNRAGAFNVPAGRYVNPTICDPDHLSAVARAFRERSTRIEHASFEVALRASGPGDFVYCDPPYAPLSRTSSFASYTAEGFSALDQDRLRAAVIAAAIRGATVVLSNSSASEIEAGYASRAARAAGLTVARVPARRAINARASGRGPVEELIVTNSPAFLRVKPRMARAGVRRQRRTA
jgi:DNA adenine methylase